MKKGRVFTEGAAFFFGLCMPSYAGDA
jgi:hypothetical protein